MKNYWLQPPVFLSPHGTGRQVCANHQSPADKYQQRAARSTFTSYTNEADAVINDRKNGTFRISLNGKWKFNYVENFADRPTDFMSPHTDVSKWPDINVPGNWELQGFGTPIYVNQSYEFCSPGYAPTGTSPIRPTFPKSGTLREPIAAPSRCLPTGMTKKSSSAPTEYAEQLSTTSTGNSWA